MIKVALVEDHNIVRSGIRLLLEKESTIQVVAEVASGRELLDQLETGTEVSIALVDMNMPGMSGLELIRILREKHPSIRVIILSMLDHENYVAQAIGEGAWGYLLKSVSREELLFAIKHIAAGSKYICNELSLRMLSKVTQLSQAPTQQTISINLSKRETEVLLLIAEGFTNNEIAGKLFTSRRTVEGHRKNLIDKTGARNTAALIRFAVQNGILK